MFPCTYATTDGHRTVKGGVGMGFMGGKKLPLRPVRRS